MADIDGAVRRILTVMFRVGTMDQEPGAFDSKHVHDYVTTNSSLETARRVATAAHVLLKNTGGLLPLPKTGKRIAVLGYAGQSAFIGPAGSGSVVPSLMPSPLSEIARQLGQNLLSPRCCASRCTNLSCPAECDNLVYELSSNGAPPTNLTRIANIAAAADIAVVFVGCFSGEGMDRTSLFLNFTTPGSDELVETVARANPNTVVVVASPGPVIMPWHPQVKAIVANFLPGQEVGSAVAAVLFGDANPSGKLPVTFSEQYNITSDQESYPGVGFNGTSYVNNGKVFVPWMYPSFSNYSEAQRGMGYRYYDRADVANGNVSVAFPFGHGLSFTEFHYYGLKVAPRPLSNGSRIVQFELTNNGSCAGAEVAQLYLAKGS